MSTQAELKAQYERWISADYPGDADTQREIEQRKAAQAHAIAAARDSKLTAEESEAALVGWMEFRGWSARRIARTMASASTRKRYVVRMQVGAE